MNDAGTELEEFLRERNAALIALDENYVARKIPKAPADMRLLILHKSRYCCTAIPNELRHESGRWLRERGYKQMSAEAILPDGELPI